MLYRKVPKTGEELSILGFGCMRLATKDMEIDEARAGYADWHIEQLLQQCLQARTNAFQTLRAGKQRRECGRTHRTRQLFR